MMHYRGALQRVADYVTLRLAERFPGHPVLGIINGRAGTASRHRILQHIVADLPELKPDRSIDDCTTTVWTDSVDALHDVAHRWLKRVDEACEGGRGPIVASFGGDGTHNQVMRAMEPESDRVSFFRVPLGSGNDAVGLASLADVLNSLDGDLETVWIPGVEVISPRRTLRAFNIASIGIDAFVTMMHQHLRRALPGNTYRIIANAALLVYERIVQLEPMHILTGEEDLGTEQRVIVAFGVHGNLTYGDHIRILPGEENLCVFRRVSLWGKLKMKRLLMEGNHVHESTTTMRRTGEITVHYNQRFPVQVDGEADWLGPEDFPLIMRTRERARRVLLPAQHAPVETRR